jgi:hypothetical protein
MKAMISCDPDWMNEDQSSTDDDLAPPLVFPETTGDIQDEINLLSGELPVSAPDSGSDMVLADAHCGPTVREARPSSEATITVVADPSATPKSQSSLKAGTMPDHSLGAKARDPPSKKATGDAGEPRPRKAKRQKLDAAKWTEPPVGPTPDDCFQTGSLPEWARGFGDFVTKVFETDIAADQHCKRLEVRLEAAIAMKQDATARLSAMSETVAQCRQREIEIEQKLGDCATTLSASKTSLANYVESAEANENARQTLASPVRAVADQFLQLGESGKKLWRRQEVLSEAFTAVARAVIGVLTKTSEAFTEGNPTIAGVETALAVAAQEFEPSRARVVALLTPLLRGDPDLSFESGQ